MDETMEKSHDDMMDVDTDGAWGEIIKFKFYQMFSKFIT